MSGWDLVYIDLGGERMPGIMKPWIHPQHWKKQKQNKTPKTYCNCSLSLPFRKLRAQRPLEAARCRRRASHARDISRSRWATRRRRDASLDPGAGNLGERCCAAGARLPRLAEEGTQCVESPGAPVDCGRAPRWVCPRARLLSLLSGSAPSSQDLGSLSFPFV